MSIWLEKREVLMMWVALQTLKVRRWRSPWWFLIVTNIVVDMFLCFCIFDFFFLLSCLELFSYIISQNAEAYKTLPWWRKWSHEECTWLEDWHAVGRTSISQCSRPLHHPKSWWTTATSGSIFCWLGSH